MNTQTKRLTLWAVVLLAAFATACMETEKANKLIVVGNAAITEGNKLLEDANAKNDKLVDSLNAAASKSPDDEESGPAVDTQAIKSTAQSAIDGFEKSATKFREAAAKFDEASKLKIHEKLKEYLTLKSQSFTKLAELADAMKGNSKTVIDTGALPKNLDENGERINKLLKEANELNEKANKIQQDNKDIIGGPDAK